MMLKGKDETLVLAVLSDHYGALCDELRTARQRRDEEKAKELSRVLEEVNSLLTRWFSETTT